MNWRFWRLRNKVLIVGYAPQVAGGVTTVTTVMRKNMPQLDLHPALRWYGPRWKVVAFFLYSISMFVFRLLFAAPRLVQVIVGSRGDAVRMLPYIWLAKLRGCKVCLHFHKNREAILGAYSATVARAVLATWARADGYCFLSNRLHDEYRGQFDPRKPCVVVPNPIGSQWLRQEVPPRSARTGGPVFLGRWCAEKGIDDLLAVMQALDASALGGGAPAQQGPFRCDIYADHCPPVNPANCDCHPWVAEDSVRRVLREATLVLLPSHAEALPTILLEAAACGTPFVASSVGGTPDIAEQSRAGLLHEVGDAEAMRKAIERLLTDGALWEECSRNGRRWVESLEVSKIVPQWQRLYADLGVTVPEPREARCARRQESEVCV
jgi:glycosyltransferase involved in cell wall biosynthesis